MVYYCFMTNSNGNSSPSRFAVGRKPCGFAAGVAIATAGALLWGFSGACAQWLFAHYEIDSAFITMVRAITAGLLFAVLLFARHREALRQIVREPRTMLALAAFGAGLFGSQFFYAWSVSVTNAGTATVLQMSNSVFVIVFVALKARAFPAARQLIALLLAVLGVVLIATQGNLTSLAMPALGVVLGLVNGLCVAFYIIFPKRQVERFGSFVATGIAMCANALLAAAIWSVSVVMHGAGMPPAEATSLAGSTAALPMFPALDMAGIAVLVLGIGVLGTFAAFGLYLKGVSVVGQFTGSLLGAFEPVGAIVIGCLWLGNMFTWADAVGFAAMLVMLVLVSLPSAPRKIRQH